MSHSFIFWFHICAVIAWFPLSLSSFQLPCASHPTQILGLVSLNCYCYTRNKYRNKTCWVHWACSVALRYMFLGWSTWDWLPSEGLIPGEDWFFPSQQLLVAPHSSPSRGAALWDFPVYVGMPTDVITKVLFRQPHRWDFMGVASRQTSWSFCPLISPLSVLFKHCAKCLD